MAHGHVMLKAPTFGTLMTEASAWFTTQTPLVQSFKAAILSKK